MPRQYIVKSVDGQKVAVPLTGESNEIVDNLTSGATNKGLSANQGRVLKEIVSDEWNSATTYAIGDYCIKGNTLYRCIQQNTNVAPPNASYWVATSVSDSLKNVFANRILEVGVTNIDSSQTTAHITFQNTINDSYVATVENYGGSAGYIFAFSTFNYTSTGFDVIYRNVAQTPGGQSTRAVRYVIYKY